MNATPVKLRDGSWGARVLGRPRVGDEITIIANSGKTWTATISKVVWQGDDAALCATGNSPARPAGQTSRHPTTRTGCSCGSVEEYEKTSDCWACRHDR